MVAPLQGLPQDLLSQVRALAAFEGPVQIGDDLAQLVLAYLGRRQFDRQGNAVDQATDASHEFERRALQGKIDADFAHPLAKEPTRLIQFPRIGGRTGKHEGRHVVDAFDLQPERLATGHQTPNVHGGVEHRGDHAPHGRPDVLTPIEDDQRRTTADPSLESLVRAKTAGHLDSQDIQHRIRDLSVLTYGGQVDEEDTIRVTDPSLRRGLHGQAGLAAAAQANQRDERVSIHKLVKLGPLANASHEPAEHLRKISRYLLGGRRTIRHGNAGRQNAPRP